VGSGNDAADIMKTWCTISELEMRCCQLRAVETIEILELCQHIRCVDRVQSFHGVKRLDFSGNPLLHETTRWCFGGPKIFEIDDTPTDAETLKCLLGRFEKLTSFGQAFNYFNLSGSQL
jgi:hypothetical protein